MFHGWNGGGSSFGYALGFPWGGVVMGAVALAIIAFFASSLIRRGQGSRNELKDANERGIDILIGRFTRGEIDADTFRSMKAEL